MNESELIRQAAEDILGPKTNQPEEERMNRLEKILETILEKMLARVRGREPAPAPPVAPTPASVQTDGPPSRPPRPGFRWEKSEVRPFGVEAKGPHAWNEVPGQPYGIMDLAPRQKLPTHPSLTRLAVAGFRPFAIADIYNVGRPSVDGKIRSVFRLRMLDATQGFWSSDSALLEKALTACIDSFRPGDAINSDVSSFSSAAVAFAKIEGEEWLEIKRWPTPRPEEPDQSEDDRKKWGPNTGKPRIIGQDFRDGAIVTLRLLPENYEPPGPPAPTAAISWWSVENLRCRAALAGMGLPQIVEARVKESIEFAQLPETEPVPAPEPKEPRLRYGNVEPRPLEGGWIQK